MAYTNSTTGTGIANTVVGVVASLVSTMYKSLPKVYSYLICYQLVTIHGQ